MSVNNELRQQVAQSDDLLVILGSMNDMQKGKNAELEALQHKVEELKVLLAKAKLMIGKHVVFCVQDELQKEEIVQLQTIKDEKDEREKELEAVKSELRKSVDALNGKDSEIESLKKELKSASESSADALNGKDEEIEALKNELKNSSISLNEKNKEIEEVKEKQL